MSKRKSRQLLNQQHICRKELPLLRIAGKRPEPFPAPSFIVLAERFFEEDTMEMSSPEEEEEATEITEEESGGDSEGEART